MTDSSASALKRIQRLEKASRRCAQAGGPTAWAAEINARSLERLAAHARNHGPPPAGRFRKDVLLRLLAGVSILATAVAMMFWPALQHALDGRSAGPDTAAPATPRLNLAKASTERAPSQPDGMVRASYSATARPEQP